MKNTKKTHKTRKEIYSVTLKPHVVKRSAELSKFDNFSQHVGDALEFYNKYLEEQKRK